MDSHTQREMDSPRSLSVDNDISMQRGTTGSVSNKISFKASVLVFVIYLRLISVIRSPKESKPATRRRDGLRTNISETYTPMSIKTMTRIDDKGTKREVISRKVLDWKRILPFLSKNIVHADSYKIFFHYLYGNTKLPNNMNYPERINRVHLDVQRTSHNSESLILEQFKSWKEAAGNNAEPDNIKTTLAELGHNDTLEIFNEYMRSDVPYMDVTHDSVPETLHNAIPSSTTWISALPSNLPHGSRVLHETHCKLQLELPKSTNTALEHDNINGDASHFCRSPDIQRGTSDNEDVFVESDQAATTLASAGEGSQTLGHHRSEFQPTYHPSSKKSGKRKREFSSEIGNESLKIMVNHYLTTQPNTRHDIHRFSAMSALEELVNNSGIGRDLALQLTYKEYCDIEEFQTKKGDDIYIMYIGKDCYLLKKASYEKLKHYAEHARSKIVHSIDREVLYMFIDIDGTPLHEVFKENFDDNGDAGIV
ncbi:hypothetical protein ACF0H5_002270 [Mactra antiquata]